MKEKEQLRIDSESSSEEEISQEMTRMTLERMTEPWDCYNNTAAAVCGNIQVSGRLHIEHLLCDGHHDDNFDIQEYDFEAKEITEQEEVVPEVDYDAIEFDAERGDAVQADLHEVDDEEYDARDHDAVEADRLEVEDEAVVGHEGIEDLGEEGAEANEEVLEEEGGDVDDYEVMYEDEYEDKDEYDCDYDTCNDCDGNEEEYEDEDE